MEIYKVADIVTDISSNFTVVYKNAGNFTGSQLYDDCIKIIYNVSDLRCVIFANDMGIPPVKSMLTLLHRKGMLQRDVSANESQCIGSLMGFIFKNILGYQNQRSRVTVNLMGVKTATVFLNPEKVFDIE